MKNLLQTTVFFFSVLLLYHTADAQDIPKPEIDHSYKPLKVEFNEEGSKYLRFLMWHQL